MVELWFVLLCGIGAKSVAHLMQYHLLQWEVAKVKCLMNSSTTLTVLNLHQNTPKGATTKIQLKRYKRNIGDIKDYQISPKRDKIASDMQDQRPNPGHTMTLHTYNPRPVSLPNINFLHLMVSKIWPRQGIIDQGGQGQRSIKVTP